MSIRDDTFAEIPALAGKLDHFHQMGGRIFAPSHTIPAASKAAR